MILKDGQTLPIIDIFGKLKYSTDIQNWALVLIPVGFAQDRYISMKKLTLEDITEELLQTPRSPTESYNWIKNTIDDICSTPEGKTAIRLREGKVKELIEEVLPLGIFGIKHYGAESEVTITPVMGSQSHDATVQGDEDNITHIEITQAHEGEGEYLRMRKLDETGQVSVAGKISKQGTKKTGLKITDENIARFQEDLKNEMLERIQQAILRKHKKDYPAKTALVVMFDEIFSMEEKHKSALDYWIKQNLLPKLKSFMLVVFISWNEKWYLEYPCQR